MKTHYAYLEKGNESDPEDYWSSTACGMQYTESPLTNIIEHVTCKKCLSKYHNHFHKTNEKQIQPKLGISGVIVAVAIEKILKPKYMNDVYTWKQVRDAIIKATEH